MITVFYTAFLLVLYTYIGYPLLISILAKASPKPWLRAPYSASVSIVMAVRNGGSMLSEQLERLAALRGKDVVEIIVVSDGSTDNTAAILRECRDSRLRFVVLTEHQGKASALNYAVAQATGEVILFLDVRPTMKLSALTCLLQNFADPAVGCATGQLLLNHNGHDAFTSAVNGLYWRYEQWIRNSESAWDSPWGCMEASTQFVVALPHHFQLD